MAGFWRHLGIVGSGKTTPSNRARGPSCWRPPTLEALEERNLLSFLPVVNYPVGGWSYYVRSADSNNVVGLDGSNTLDSMPASSQEQPAFTEQPASPLPSAQVFNQGAWSVMDIGNGGFVIRTQTGSDPLGFGLSLADLSRLDFMNGLLA